MVDPGGITPAMLNMTDGVIALRPLRLDDAAHIWLAIQESRAALQQWLPTAGRVASADELRAYAAMAQQDLSAGIAYDFAVQDAPDGYLLGGIGLTQINRHHRFANLYYWIRTSRTRQGIACRAIRLAARFGLEVLGLQRVEIVVELGNIASMRAAEKAGARREAMLRNRLVNNGRAVDAAMFSLIPSDLTDW
jgi:RimJ/RimL family protein N-acetyltransferase